MKKFLLTSLAVLAAVVTQAQGNAIIANRGGFWVGKTTNPVGQPWCIHPTIINNGTDSLTSIGFTYTLNGGEAIHKTQQLHESNIIAAGKFKNIPIFFDPVTEPGTYSLKVTLDEINGGSNSADSTQCTNTTAWSPVFAAVTIPADKYDYRLYDANTTPTFTDWNQTKKTFRGNIFVSAVKNPELAGKKIVGIRMTGLPTTGISDFHFMKANVNNENYNALLSHQMDTNNDFLVLTPENGVAEGYWAAPVTLTDDRFHTGWSFAFEFAISEPDENNALPIAIYPTTEANNCAYIHVVDGGDLRGANDWINEGKNGNTGALPLTLIIEGNDPAAGIADAIAEDSEVAYYDLQGRKVLNPQSGLYIKKQGNHATKVVK